MENVLYCSNYSAQKYEKNIQQKYTEKLAMKINLLARKLIAIVAILLSRVAFISVVISYGPD